MDFLELAETRRSVRKFDGRPLSAGDVDRILRAGILAPTAKNLQPERIYVLQSEEALRKLKTCTPCDYGTKTAFLVCYDEAVCWKRDSGGVNSGYVDAAIVATHMMLECAALGAGSTWVMWFDADAARRAFALPAAVVPVCFLVTGYPAADAPVSPNHGRRKTTDELVTTL